MNMTDFYESQYLNKLFVTKYATGGNEMSSEELDDYVNELLKSAWKEEQDGDSQLSGNQRGTI